MLQITIRKDFNGNIISEQSTPIKGSTAAEIKFLGQLLADELRQNSNFHRFCETYRTEGTIKTNCCGCGQEFRVEVQFPAYDRGFDPKMAACLKCGLIQTVYDPHEYDGDGNVIR